MLPLGVGTLFGVVASVTVMTGAVYLAVTGYDKLLDQIGFIGSVASVLGIIITLIQVLRTKHAAIAAQNASEAARDAAHKAAKELRTNHYRYSLFLANRLLSNLKLNLTLRKWSLAALRADDLAEHTLQLAYASPMPDHQWIQAKDSLRQWASQFQQGKTNRSLAYSVDGWIELCDMIQEKITRESDPFT